MFLKLGIRKAIPCFCSKSYFSNKYVAFLAIFSILINYLLYSMIHINNFALQMYAITRQANLLSRLGDLECLILLVSCICHDLDHPGYNNIYQINARTELALRWVFLGFFLKIFPIFSSIFSLQIQ